MEEPTPERRLRSSVQTVPRQFVPPSAHSGAQNSSRILLTYVCRLRLFPRRQFCGAKKAMSLTSMFLSNPPCPLFHVPIISGSQIRVEGLISKFAPGAGRTGTDRQFFFINGRPCAPAKVQKAINEVYRTFNANKSPFVIADFILPTGTTRSHPAYIRHDVNVLIQILVTSM